MNTAPIAPSCERLVSGEQYRDIDQQHNAISSGTPCTSCMLEILPFPSDQPMVIRSTYKLHLDAWQRYTALHTFADNYYSVK